MGIRPDLDCTAALDKVRDAIKDTVKREGIDSACLFTHSIDKAATYIP